MDASSRPALAELTSTLRYRNSVDRANRKAFQRTLGRPALSLIRRAGFADVQQTRVGWGPDSVLLTSICSRSIDLPRSVDEAGPRSLQLEVKHYGGTLPRLVLPHVTDIYATFQHADGTSRAFSLTENEFCSGIAIPPRGDRQGRPPVQEYHARTERLYTALALAQTALDIAKP